MSDPFSPMTPREELELRLTALILGELPHDEAVALRAQILKNPRLATLHARLRKAVELLREVKAMPAEPVPAEPLQLSAERRARLLAHFQTPAPAPLPARIVPMPKPKRDWSWLISTGIAAALVAFVSIPASTTVLFRKVSEAPDFSAESSGFVNAYRGDADLAAPEMAPQFALKMPVAKSEPSQGNFSSAATTTPSLAALSSASTTTPSFSLPLPSAATPAPRLAGANLPSGPVRIDDYGAPIQKDAFKGNIALPVPEAVNITGNTRTWDKVIRREIAGASGGKVVNASGTVGGPMDGRSESAGVAGNSTLAPDLAWQQPVRRFGTTEGTMLGDISTGSGVTKSSGNVFYDQGSVGTTNGDNFGLQFKKQDEAKTTLGNGSLVLGSGNTYTGSTTINGGTLSVTSGTQVTAGNTTVTSGASTVLNGTTAFGTTNAFTSGGTVGTPALKGNFTTSDASETTNTLTLSGNVSGTGELTKSGAGTLNFNGGATAFEGTVNYGNQIPPTTTTMGNLADATRGGSGISPNASSANAIDALQFGATGTSLGTGITAEGINAFGFDPGVGRMGGNEGSGGGSAGGGFANRGTAAKDFDTGAGQNQNGPMARRDAPIVAPGIVEANRGIALPSVDSEFAKNEKLADGPTGRLGRVDNLARGWAENSPAAPAEAPLSPEHLDTLRFFQTAQSRAPELNLFGRPHESTQPTAPGGPQAGTAPAQNITPDTQHLYSSVDELLFRTDPNAPAAAPGKDAPPSTPDANVGKLLEQGHYSRRKLADGSELAPPAANAPTPSEPQQAPQLASDLRPEREVLIRGNAGGSAKAKEVSGLAAPAFGDPTPVPAAPAAAAAPALPSSSPVAGQPANPYTYGTDGGQTRIVIGSVANLRPATPAPAAKPMPDAAKKAATKPAPIYLPGNIPQTPPAAATPAPAAKLAQLKKIEKPREGAELEKKLEATGVEAAAQREVTRRAVPVRPSTESDARHEYNVSQGRTTAVDAPAPVSAEESERRRQAQATAATPQPEIDSKANAFSTFSLNVSDVSFKLASASLDQGKMPDPATVRSEEFINAFDYRDPEPAPGNPLAFATERARYPFAQNRDLLRLSVKTAAAGRQPGRPLNLVLLLDNSGSMERADRTRIVREALRVLCAQLQPQDKLSIVAFARTPRLWADGIAGDKAGEMVKRVGEITPQGGTNLSAALDLGYATALRHFQVGSINRVVLLTDGAANLGNVDPETLKKKVEDNRKQGIALDCFGIGWEGYDDEVLEALSRNGDGRYGFINTPEEATTGFAAQLAGALRVAASDVKVQIEFNPQRVTSWRQIGYAKHQLTKEQFRDNTVDAAEIGAAESGNALYAVEVNPRGEGDLATVRVRFKVPGTSDYREHAWPVPYNGPAQPLEQSTSALRLAGTASAFSEWLVGSPYAMEVTPDRRLSLMNGVPAITPADPRPAKLEWMIRTARSLAGR